MSGHADDYPETCLPILKAALASEPSEHDLSNIYFQSDTIYRHNILQIPYTTYDCRQDVDTINPHTSRRDIMCLAATPSTSGPGSEREPSPGPSSSSRVVESEGELSPGPLADYVYGRVLGIFHGNIMYRGSGSLDYRRRRFDFLWVRRYSVVPTDPDGENSWSSKRLDCVTIDPVVEAASCDFLNPSDVLRGAHIIPRFSLGARYHSEENQIFSKAAQDHLDWAEYYINR